MTINQPVADDKAIGKPRPLKKVILYSGLSFLAYYGYCELLRGLVPAASYPTDCLERGFLSSSTTRSYIWTIGCSSSS